MAKYTNYTFVNRKWNDHSVQTVSKFIAYRTWNTNEVWYAEIVDDGNAFFHWQPGKKAQGHKDSIINYISVDGKNWQATISNYEFFHSPNGDRAQGHKDVIIGYISADNQGYEGSFAEVYVE